MIFKKFKNKNQNGFSIVEVIIASAVISLSLISIIQIAGQSLGFSRRSLNVYYAATLLEEGAESVRIIRDNGWSNISSLSSSSIYYPVFSTSTNMWTLSVSPVGVGNFTRTVVIGPAYRDSNSEIITTGGTAATGTRLVTVSVSWKDGLGTITKTLSFYINDIFS